jgi:RHS repeat-associated protein
MTTDETGRQFVYDAWNRLKVVKNSGGTTLKTYTYDAMGRRVAETASGTTTDLYYSNQWQVLEEAVSGTTKSRYVWSPVYVDALILRDRDADNSSGNGLEERLYAQQDANFNVTALVNTSGTVVERYAYDPYGVATVMNASWSTLGSSAYSWVYLHQGGRLDATSGLHHFRNRDYSAALGRWANMDPIRYQAGDVNLYRAVGNNALTIRDPSGLQPPRGTVQNHVFRGFDRFGGVYWSSFVANAPLNNAYRNYIPFADPNGDTYWFDPTIARWPNLVWWPKNSSGVAATGPRLAPQPLQPPVPLAQPMPVPPPVLPDPGGVPDKPLVPIAPPDASAGSGWYKPYGLSPYGKPEELGPSGYGKGENNPDHMRPGSGKPGGPGAGAARPSGLPRPDPFLPPLPVLGWNKPGQDDVKPGGRWVWPFEEPAQCKPEGPPDYLPGWSKGR